MKSETERLIETLNRLMEDELKDDFENVEVTDTDLHEPPTTEVNTTDELDAKTKISRALDVLKKAVEDFKNTTVEEVDLLKDAELLNKIANIDGILATIETILTGKEETEQQAEPLEEAPEADEDNEEGEEVNFDDEASLDLFNNDEE